MPRAVPLATRQDIVERRHLDGQIPPTDRRRARHPLRHRPRPVVRLPRRRRPTAWPSAIAPAVRATRGATPTPSSAAPAGSSGEHSDLGGRAGPRRAARVSSPPDRVPFGAGRCSAPSSERPDQPAAADPQRPRGQGGAGYRAPHDVWEVDAVEKERLAVRRRRSAGCRSPTPTRGGCWPASFPPQAQWQAITPAGRAGLVPPRLRAVGPAGADAGGQRPSLGPEQGAAAGPGALADRTGRGVDWIPPGQPQVNGIIERGNGVTQQWADPSTSRTAPSCGAGWSGSAWSSGSATPRSRACRGWRRTPACATRGGRTTRGGRRRSGSWREFDRALSSRVYYRRANARGAIWMYGWSGPGLCPPRQGGLREVRTRRAPLGRERSSGPGIKATRG